MTGCEPCTVAAGGPDPYNRRMSYRLLPALALLAVTAAAAEPATLTVSSASQAGVASVAPEAADLPMANRSSVRKSQRRMYLLNGDRVLRSYRVALGLVPEGNKQRAGGFRTPQGS